MKQGRNARCRNCPGPFVLLDAEYALDAGAVIPALDDDVALGVKRCLQETRAVRIVDVAQDDVEGSHNCVSRGW